MLKTAKKKKHLYKQKSPLKRFLSKSTSEKITYVAFFVFFIIMSIIYIYPIYNAVLTSFTAYSGQETTSIWDFFWVRGRVQFESWQNIIDDFTITTESGDFNLAGQLFNSIWFTVLKTGLSLFASALLAYAVAKFNFPGKKLLFLIAVFVQTIPIFGSGPASYKLFDTFGMINNPFLFWVAWCTGFDFTFIILHGTFSGISNSYSESAKIDGANNLTILFKIVLPMVTPVLLALFISNSLGVWNDYSTIMVYLNEYPTLAYGLYSFQEGTMSTRVPYAQATIACATLISAVPIIIIYSLSQKLILTNISVGGLKG